jgi:hypothetical protein
METLKKIVSNQYFPAGAVLTVVLMFWVVGILGGLSLLHNNQPPLTTLTWLLFVYGAAVLTPLAGILAAVDLVRRWRRNRAEAAYAGQARDGQAGEEHAFLEDQGQPAAPVAAASVPATQPAAAAPSPAAEPADTARADTPQSAPKASQPKKNSKQAGRKQAA